MILCSVTTCTIKATTAINNNNYFFYFQSNQHKAAGMKIDKERTTAATANSLTRDYALERDRIIIIIIIIITTTIYDSVWLVRSSVAVIIKLA